ncbi:hypothetical protein GCM10020255_014300 [Rhodococcus baikonurensis]
MQCCSKFCRVVDKRWTTFDGRTPCSQGVEMDMVIAQPRNYVVTFSIEHFFAAATDATPDLGDQSIRDSNF